MRPRSQVPGSGTDVTLNVMLRGEVNPSSQVGNSPVVLQEKELWLAEDDDKLRERLEHTPSTTGHTASPCKACRSSAVTASVLGSNVQTIEVISD